MTFTASCMYHRGYRKGDILTIILKNGVKYNNCIYSHIRCNYAVFVYNNKPLVIDRYQIHDIIMVQKSLFRNRKLYRRNDFI